MKKKKVDIKVGRPPKGKPEYPVKSIRDLEPDTYLDFKHWAEKQGKTVGEAMTELMKIQLRETEQEELALRVENIRGR